ncbi:MAG: hypothetical protein ACHQAQ_17075, partial [Hyphomicrobiales bacterium]
MQIGRRDGIGRPPVEPALGDFESRSAQGRTPAATLLVPVPRQLGEPRMLAHPGKIGMQRRVERCQRLFLVVALGAEHPIQPAQGRRSLGIGDAPRHDGDDPLAESSALFQLPGADAGRDRIRADGEHHRVG